MTCSPAWSPGSSEVQAAGGYGWATEPPQVVVQSQCPPRTRYHPEDVKKSAEELRALLKSNPKSPTAVMMNDYRKLRRGCDGIEQ